MADGLQQETPDWFGEIDHTGDLGIKVEAPTLPTLFERTAWGMFRLLTNLETVQPRKSYTVTVAGEDWEDLLVQWLSELNFLHVTEYVLFGTFSVDQLGAFRLKALVEGEPVDAKRHTVYTEIKAVTYHGLKIHKTGGRWHVQVIFDM